MVSNGKGEKRGFILALAVPGKMQQELGMHYAARIYSDCGLWAKQELWDIKADVSWLSQDLVSPQQSSKQFCPVLGLFVAQPGV